MKPHPPTLADFTDTQFYQKRVCIPFSLTCVQEKWDKQKFNAEVWIKTYRQNLDIQESQDKLKNLSLESKVDSVRSPRHSRRNSVLPPPLHSKKRDSSIHKLILRRAPKHLIRDNSTLSQLSFGSRASSIMIRAPLLSRARLSRYGSRAVSSQFVSSDESPGSNRSLATTSRAPSNASLSMPRGLGKSMRKISRPESAAKSMEYQIRLVRAQKKQVNTILRKDTLFRNEEDTLFLATYLKGFKAFVNVPDLLMMQLCAIMTLSRYEVGQAGTSKTF